MVHVWMYPWFAKMSNARALFQWIWINESSTSTCFVHRHKQNIVNTSQTSMEMVSLGDAYRWKCMQLEPEIKTHSNKAIPAYHCPKKWTGPVHLHTPGHQELMWCSAVFAKVSFLHETTFTSVSSLLPGCIIFPTVIYISWYIRQFISFWGAASLETFSSLRPV